MGNGRGWKVHRQCDSLPPEYPCEEEISATQSYVPDEKKGRFNGAFNMLYTVGSFSGQLLAGALTIAVPVRGLLTGFMLTTAVAAVVVIGGNKAEVKRIFNR